MEPLNPHANAVCSPSLVVDVVPAGWLASGAPPLEIDIGCHKGTFLVAMAAAWPERNFFGIDRQSSRVERCLSKAARLGLANVAAAFGEGLETVARQLPARCVDVIHVLFPDPWPKRRHHARRLVNQAFLTEAARVLKTGGFLRLMTDDAAYFGAMREAAGAWVTVEDPRDYPATEFEKKFRAVGMAIYALTVRPPQATSSR